MKKNLISVVMSVFNGANFLREAIISVLNQTYSDFEFIIIDDGSSDDSSEIIQSFNDSRIHFFCNPCNLGLAKSLNRGIELSSGEFIARMDCDDVCIPDRFEIQVEFLKSHDDIGICGSSIYMLQNDSKRRIQVYLDKYLLSFMLLFHNTMAHPSVMMKKVVLNDFHLRYDENMKAAQDYDFWARCAEVTNLANCPEPLLYFRVHGNNTIDRLPGIQEKAAASVRRRLLGQLGIMPSSSEAEIHEMLSSFFLGEKFFLTKGAIRRIEEWLKKILDSNERLARYPRIQFRHLLADIFNSVCCQYPSMGLPLLKIYYHSSLTNYLNNPLTNKIRAFYRCVRSMFFPR
ncbi:MAG: glycosyltransferase [Candidatus Riflebacteria bacterium]|nr:glycosyltransferase [Candidatus Riflebacteria bacterium]